MYQVVEQLDVSSVTRMVGVKIGRMLSHKTVSLTHNQTREEKRERYRDG